jgi:hypothetical protein
LADGRGFALARYVTVIVSLAVPITVVELAYRTQNKLVVIAALVAGFLLAALAYGITTRICIAMRLAKLHAIKGIDPVAADAALDRNFRNATLTVRARFVGERGLACKRAGALPRIADARIEGEDVVVVTEYLRTRSDAAGSRSYYTNWEIYRAVMAIAGAMPPCERFAIELAGDPARS